MAATYTDISLEDMETFLKRAYRALRPKQGVQKGEYYYDLSLSPHVVIRVWTSIERGSQSGAGVGQDAIRILLMGVQANRPLMKGKAPIVKRTQGWKNSLQGKIEDLMELFDEKESYWDSRGIGQSQPSSKEPEVVDDRDTDDDKDPVAPLPPPASSWGNIPITPPQLKYLIYLMRGTQAKNSHIRGMLYDYGLEEPYDSEELGKLTKSQAGNLISRLAPSKKYAELEAEIGDYPDPPEYRYDFSGD